VAKKKAKSAADRPKQGPTFEEAVERLKAIVHELEEGEIGLDESLRRYEEGVKLIRRCTTQLEAAERKLEVLDGVDAEGRPSTRPLDDEAMTLQQKAERRSQRRSDAGSSGEGSSTGAPPEDDMDASGRLF
jgi:exodeoxyribonuclease VII small subunit